MSNPTSELPTALVRLVRDLLTELKGTAVTECELRVGSYRVIVRRSLAAAPVAAPVAAHEDASIPPTWLPLNSPLTGIFYLTETPQSPPFVTVGATIVERQVIGLIESMKMYNPVESDLAGLVRAINVTNGTLVEKGYPLIYVEPIGEVP